MYQNVRDKSIENQELILHCENDRILLELSDELLA